MQFTVGVAVLDHNNKFLLITREHEPFPGRYALPGGRPEAQDLSLCETAERELAELTQNEVRLQQLDCFFEDPEWPFFVFSAVSDHFEVPGGLWVTSDDLDEMESRKELAPHVHEACTAIAREAKTNLDIKALVIRNARLAVLAHYQPFTRHDGIQTGGWNHFLPKEGIGVIGTAFGIRVLASSEMVADEDPSRDASATRKRYIDPSIEWLRGAQKKDGGWSTLTLEQAENPAIKGRSITESTAIALFSILESGHLDLHSDHMVQNAAQWLRNNQLDDGGWGLDVGSDRARVLPTTLTLEALRFLSQDAGIKRAVVRGINWLLAAQTSKGGWGRYAGNRETIAHTARVLCFFFSEKEARPDSRVEQALDRGIKFLQNQLLHHEHQTLLSPFEEDEWLTSPHFQALSWWHFPASWCLKALASSSRRSERELEDLVLTYLLSCRDSRGLWAIPGKTSRGELWLWHDIIEALKVCHTPLVARPIGKSERSVVSKVLNLAHEERQKTAEMKSKFATLKRHSRIENLFFLLLGLLAFRSVEWLYNLARQQADTVAAQFVIGIVGSVVAAGLLYLLDRAWKRWSQ